MTSAPNLQSLGALWGSFHQKDSERRHLPGPQELLCLSFSTHTWDVQLRLPDMASQKC